MVDNRVRDAGRRHREDPAQPLRRQAAPQRGFQQHHGGGGSTNRMGYGRYPLPQAGGPASTMVGPPFADTYASSYTHGVPYFQQSVPMRPPPGVPVHHGMSHGTAGPLQHTYGSHVPAHAGLATAMAAGRGAIGSGAIGSGAIGGVPLEAAPGQRVYTPHFSGMDGRDSAGTHPAQAGGARAPTLPPGMSSAYATGGSGHAGSRGGTLGDSRGGHSGVDFNPSPVQHGAAHTHMSMSSGAPAFRPMNSESPASSSLQHGYSRSGSYSS